MTIDRNRPYGGQVHTFVGARGQAPVAGVTVRDVYDAMTIGFARAGGADEEQLANASDLYGINLEDVDPIAAIQNACCALEEMMGTFPNITIGDRT